MSDLHGGGWMAATAGQYITVTTRITGTGAAVTRLLKADPRRWWVQFNPNSGTGNMSPFVPGNWPAGAAPVAFSANAREFKFRDCPSVLTGEWWGLDSANTGWLIHECLYIGE